MAAAGRGILITGMTAYLFYDHWTAWILMVPIALLYVKNWEEESCKQKKEEFREQFRESIQTLSAILKVGYSVENAIRETWKEICPIYKKKTRIIKEYETMVHQLDLNMTAEEVMKQFFT